MLVKDFLQICNQIAPFETQENWDNSGTQILFPQIKVTKVLIATDFTTTTLNEAIKSKCQAMVVHHPPIFKPLKSLEFSNPFHRLLMVAIQNKISVIALHTNFDAAETGMNEYLLQRMGISKTTPFLMQAGNYSKLTVFVPKSYTEKVRQAICDAGAGHIGNYSDCSFKVSGVGTFKGGKNANPFLGKPRILEFADEDRLETIFKNSDKKKILKALFDSHPYEEVAHDLTPLANEKPGLGRIGYFEKSVTPSQLAKLIKTKLKISHIRISKIKKNIQKIAIITGGAGSFYKEALKNNCDAYISGDVKHNEWIEAHELGLVLVDASHFGTEKFFSSCFIDNVKRLKVKQSPQLIPSKTENFPYEIFD